jgi:hypothetical protein
MKGHFIICVVLASAKNLEYEIKTGKSDAADHAASIEDSLGRAPPKGAGNNLVIIRPSPVQYYVATIA